MSLAFVLGVGLVTTASVAAAERAIAVDVPAGAPFDAEELRRAMRVRIAPEGGPVHVRVTVTAAGVQVAARGGVRAIDVAGLEGAAAARLVALAASDLVLDELAVVPSTRRPRTVTVGLLGGAAGWDSLLAGAALDATLAAGDRFVAVELGGAQLRDDALSLTAGIARLGGGVRAGIFEVRGGLTLAPISVATGPGDRTVLVGAGASVRVRLAVSARVRGVFALGADAFATQTEYRAGGMTVLATPRVAPWLGAGLEVTP